MEPTEELNLHTLQHHTTNTHDDLFTSLFKEHQLDIPADSFKLNSPAATSMDDTWEYDWTGLLSDVMDPLNVSLL